MRLSKMTSISSLSIRSSLKKSNPKPAPSTPLTDEVLIIGFQNEKDTTTVEEGEMDNSYDRYDKENCDPFAANVSTHFKFCLFDLYH